VKHDETGFTVTTEEIDIKVLGTQFNVMAYPDVDFTEVVLEQGKVEVAGTSAHFEKTLAPGEKLIFLPKENKYQLKQVDTEAYTAWKDGYLMLNDETLENAAYRIERWYNVDIEIKDETLKNYRFKATFQDEPLEEVLRLMAISTPMEYTIEKREAGSDNVYKKRKVTIKRKQ
jgi:ferric-dicitrate binding protein FerR (iron transport regulator)